MQVGWQAGRQARELDPARGARRLHIQYRRCGRARVAWQACSMYRSTDAPNAPPKKMSRQKARLARRDAAAAQKRAEAEQEVRDADEHAAEDEKRALDAALASLHVELHEIAPDGHWCVCAR